MSAAVEPNMVPQKLASQRLREPKPDSIQEDITIDQIQPMASRMTSITPSSSGVADILDASISPDKHPQEVFQPAESANLGLLPPFSSFDMSKRMSVGSTYSSAAHGRDGELLGARRPRVHKLWKKKHIKLIIDTPGYGDELDTLATIDRMRQYIEDQNVKWLELEQSTKRKEDLSELDDPRFDLCLFCIPAHRLRHIDVKYMYELGKVVPVVPVVTKADTMTTQEASNFRTEVANALANPMVPGVHDKINLFPFGRDALGRAGVMDVGDSIPPFLVIASNEVNDELSTSGTPTYWPERSNEVNNELSTSGTPTYWPKQRYM
eukprot:gene28181-31277_t